MMKRKMCVYGGRSQIIQKCKIIWSKSLSLEVGGVAAGPVKLQTEDDTILLEHCT